MADTIRYAAGQSSLGPFVAALSERGLAMVEFGEMNEADLRARFPDADSSKIRRRCRRRLTGWAS